MNENFLEEVETGVLKIKGDNPGPEEVEYKGTIYYRFMDFFYVTNKNLDELEPEQVSNLCRARVKYPDSISVVNEDVRKVFKALAQALKPSSLLEIGAGRNPIFAPNEHKPDCYILADADSEVVTYHANLSIDCYEFSQNICELPYFDDFFEMVIAVFVLHFPFAINQLLEINRRLKVSGVIIANVYRRSSESREKLTQNMMDVGFKIIKIQDTDNLCRDHEYWILGKEHTSVQICASKLKDIIKK
jgi:SAM-dependent methyltransferase